MLSGNAISQEQLVECQLIEKIAELLNAGIPSLDIGRLICWNILHISKQKTELPLAIVRLII